MKRVLIIAYYWPPAGGPGVQRWLKFVKYFRDFGIEPVMYVPENPHYPIQDASFQEEVPEKLEVLKLPIKEPYKYAKLFFKKKTKKISSGIIDEKDPSFVEKLMLFARGNWFIPDARIGWVKPSVGYLSKYLEANKDIDTVITTGPPHSMHLIGRGLKKELGVHWVADFRDPWTSIHYHKSLRLTKSAAKKHKELERSVLQEADAIVVTSPSTKTEFEAITNRPISVITNGYDLTETMSPHLDTCFSLVHVGSLLTNRNPLLLWEVLSEMASADASFRKHLKIRLVGLVAKEVRESIAALKLEDNLELLGYMAHREALQLQFNAQTLLLIEMNRPETKVILPGKLFEYLKSRRPIVAIGPEGSDMEHILNDSESGYFFQYSEKEKLKDTLVTLYNQFKGKGIPDRTGPIEKYSRKQLTGEMAELLKSL